MNLILLEAGGLMEFISQPWHWAFSGAAIAFVVFLMNYMGRSLGMSTIYKDICQISGAGKKVAFFNFDIKSEYWRIFFVLGVATGGYIASHFLQSPTAVNISDATLSSLEAWGWEYPEGHGYWPTHIFNFSNPIGVILAILGGFFIGFGSRYGDGCTSGHAITGLAHFQLPSLITVIGFFIGGMIMVWGILPLIFG